MTHTITDGYLAMTAHISDAQIAVDIADTEAEIANLRRLQAAEEEVARTSPSFAERKMADFKAGARPHQIAARQAFVDFLRSLQGARASRTSAEDSAEPSTTARREGV